MWKRLPLDRTCPIPQFRERARRERPLRRLPVATVQSAVQEQKSRQIVGLGDASIPHLALDQGTRTSLPLSPPCPKNAVRILNVLRLCRQKRYSALLTRTANNFSIPVEWGNQPTSTCSHPSKAGNIRQLNRFAAVCPVLLGNEGKGSKGESYGVRTGSALGLRNEVLLNEVLLKLIKDLE